MADIARCQNLNLDFMKSDPSYFESYLKIFVERNQKVVDDRFGPVKFWSDAIEQETVDKLLSPCSDMSD